MPPLKTNVAGAIALWLLGALSPSAIASPIEICIGPASGAPGTRVSVPLTVQDANGVAAFQIDIRYDPGLLAPAGVRLGVDTASAGGWTVDSQVLSAGLVRVLAYSSPPAGLSQGFKSVAVVDFDVHSSQPVAGVPFPLTNCVLGDANGSPLSCAICLQPGIEGAAPRFAVSLVDDGFAFRPARIPIERGDWVLWRNAGSFRFHTTTSGAGCALDGLWRGDLPPGGRFVRPFQEAQGQVLPYFSEPDCPIGMTGEVDVTFDIHLTATGVSGSTLLTWTGGSGLYRVVRSDAPNFISPAIATLSPDGGDAGVSFADSALVGAGGALFYLVLNKF